MTKPTVIAEWGAWPVKPWVLRIVREGAPQFGAMGAAARLPGQHWQHFASAETALAWAGRHGFPVALFPRQEAS